MIQSQSHHDGRCFFLLMVHLQPNSTLFPYTTLFRSASAVSVNVASRRSEFRSGNSIHEVTEMTPPGERSEEHTSELQSRRDLVCRLLLETKKSLETNL